MCDLGKCLSIGLSVVGWVCYEWPDIPWENHTRNVELYGDLQCVSAKAASSPDVCINHDQFPEGNLTEPPDTTCTGHCPSLLWQLTRRLELRQVQRCEKEVRANQILHAVWSWLFEDGLVGLTLG